MVNLMRAGFAAFCLTVLVGCAGTDIECECFCVKTDGGVEEISVTTRTCVPNFSNDVPKWVTNVTECPIGFEPSGCENCEVQEDDDGESDCTWFPGNKQPAPSRSKKLAPTPDPKFGGRKK